MPTTERDDSDLVRRAITRPLSERLNSAAAEVEKIIDATYNVVARTGTVDPTMRDILKEAGLSTQAFYRYFSSKDELWLVIIDDGRRRLSDYLRHQLDKEQTGRDKVVRWMEGMFAQATDTAAAGRTRPFVTNALRLMEQHPAEFRLTIATLVEQLATAIDELADEEALKRSPTHDDAMSIYCLTVARMEDHIVLRTAPSREEIDATIDFAFRALGAAPAKSSGS